MTDGALLYEGSGISISSSSDEKCQVLEYTDDANFYDRIERPSFTQKGEHRNHISSILHGTLEEKAIPTYFIRPDGGSKMLIRTLSMFPMEIYCYNAGGGSMASRFGLQGGEVLPMTVVEFFLKGREKGGAPVSVSKLHTIKTITEGDVKTIQVRALMANRILWDFLYSHGLVMAELKLKFGRDFDRRLLIGCDLSPDNMRLWDRTDHEKIDRDRYMGEIGTDEQSYRRVAQMLTD